MKTYVTYWPQHPRAAVFVRMGKTWKIKKIANRSLEQWKTGPEAKWMKQQRICPEEEKNMRPASDFTCKLVAYPEAEICHIALKDYQRPAKTECIASIYHTKIVLRTKNQSGPNWCDENI